MWKIPKKVGGHEWHVMKFNPGFVKCAKCGIEAKSEGKYVLISKAYMRRGVAHCMGDLENRKRYWYKKPFKVRLKGDLPPCVQGKELEVTTAPEGKRDDNRGVFVICDEQIVYLPGYLIEVIH